MTKGRGRGHGKVQRDKGRNRSKVHTKDQESEQLLHFSAPRLEDESGQSDAFEFLRVKDPRHGLAHYGNAVSQR